MRATRILSLFAIFVLLAVASSAQSNHPSQTFDTSAGPVKVTPLYHASMLIEAGGKNIYVDPAKPANFSGLPKADLILITDIHGDHMDPEAIAAISKLGHANFRAASRRGDGHHRSCNLQRRNQIMGRLVDRSDPDVQPEARSGSRQALPRQGSRQRLHPHLWR